MAAFALPKRGHSGATRASPLSTRLTHLEGGTNSESQSRNCSAVPYAAPECPAHGKSFGSGGTIHRPRRYPAVRRRQSRTTCRRGAFGKRDRRLPCPADRWRYGLPAGRLKGFAADFTNKRLLAKATLHDAACQREASPQRGATLGSTTSRLPHSGPRLADVNEDRDVFVLEDFDAELAGLLEIVHAAGAGLEIEAPHPGGRFRFGRGTDIAGGSEGERSRLINENQVAGVFVLEDFDAELAGLLEIVGAAGAGFEIEAPEPGRALWVWPRGRDSRPRPPR